MSIPPDKTEVGPSPSPSPSPTPTSTSHGIDHDNDHDSSKSQSSKLSPNIGNRLHRLVTYVPPRCRHDPSKPTQLSLSLNFLFAFAATFSVANLYYNHPILHTLALEFHVSDETASQVPTVAQAGYACGLLFICPLGDLLKRRPFVLLVMLFTATVWIGLCITHSFGVFLGLTFITSVTTVTPQLMLPLVGDLAPPHRRATALSIVGSGLSLGMLLARFLSGTVANFTSWRNVYWLACGLQYLIVVLLYLFMPDYPSTNPDKKLSSYPSILMSILRMVFKYPVLVQCCLTGCLTSTTFTSFWTTLTFLLTSPRYNIATVFIGLFGLAGAIPLLAVPPIARLVIDKHVPLFSTILGLIIALVGILIGTFAGLHSLAGPIIESMILDLGLQVQQVANRSSFYSIEPKGRNRTNTAYMVAVFCGQLMGTAIGNKLYAEGGWIKSGTASIGFIGGAFLVSFSRGPWETGWVGWSGGWSIARRDLHGAMAAGKKADVEEAKGVVEGTAGNDSEKANLPESEKDLIAEVATTTTTTEKENEGRISDTAIPTPRDTDAETKTNLSIDEKEKEAYPSGLSTAQDSKTARI